MAVWLFTYEPYEGERTSAQMEIALQDAEIKAEFVQLRTWLIETSEPVADLDGSHSSALMDKVSALLEDGKQGFVLAPIHSIAGKGWTGDHGAIARFMVPGVDTGPL